MDQQPQESASDPEASVVEVQPPEEPKARPSRRRHLVLILSALAIVLVVGASLGSYLVFTNGQHPSSPTPTTRALPTPTATKTLAQRWQVVDSPTIGKDSGLLYTVAASSPTDAWALGTDTTFTFNGIPANGYDTPLLLHWDGQNWKTVAAPSLQDASMEIHDIAALAPNNAWLVGYMLEGGLNSASVSCLIMHWDGQQWRQVPPPSIQAPSCDLDDITALSANDIWAVGYTQVFADIQLGSPLPEQTLVLHWNGQQWSVVPTPNPGTTCWLSQVTARAANDIWAIGGLQQQLPKRGSFPPTYTLIEHWGGQQWSVVPSPSPGTQDNELSGITALAPNDVWAVGQYASTHIQGQEGLPVYIEQALTMHWDGQHWSVVPGPTLPGNPQESILNAVAALGPDDIWAVGSTTDVVTADDLDTSSTTFVNASQMLIEHWDGKQWSVVAVQAPGQGSALYGLARVPNMGQMWAVGGWSQSKGPTMPTTTLTLLMG